MRCRLFHRILLILMTATFAAAATRQIPVSSLPSTSCDRDQFFLF